jgi:hypothetical protein
MPHGARLLHERLFKSSVLLLECLLRSKHAATMTSGRIFPLSFSAGVSALAPVFLRKERYGSLKTEERLFHGKKQSGNRRPPVEEGDWKILQDAGPTRKSPPRQSCSEFFYIY